MRITRTETLEVSCILDAHLTMCLSLRLPRYGDRWLWCWSCHREFQDGDPIALAVSAEEGHTNKPLCQDCVAQARATEGVES